MYKNVLLDCIIFVIKECIVLLIQVLFFSMLVMYSAFVLTSVDTEYYVQDIAKIYEYYVYFWGVGDLIEELISCFVSTFD